MNPATDTKATQSAQRLAPMAIVSMLSDDAAALTQPFDGRPILGATLERILIAGVTPIVLVWDDQFMLVRAALDRSFSIKSIGPRRPIPWLDATTAALRWSDGWRGGLLGTTEFDRGFDVASILDILRHHDADAALLVSPHATFLEPATIAALLERLESDDNQSFAFAPGPVGSGAMLVRRSQLDELERGRRGPGSLLTYHPDRPVHDPLAKAFAVAVPSRVSRSLVRLAPDGGRNSRRLSLAQLDVDGRVESIVAKLEADRAIDPLPLELVLDCTTRRATKPIWTIHATAAQPIVDFSPDAAAELFAEIAAFDRDTRITLGGIGDPLLHPKFDAILSAAHDVGLRAIHVETDLLPDDASLIERLASSSVDIISVHLPAVMRDTYQRLMGVDRIADAIGNIQRLLTARMRRGAGVPIIVPTFAKCVANFAEMEAWYDQWIRAVGAAVIVGPSDFGGQIPFAGIDDLTPPSRRGCRRLSNRITVRADGSIVPCEEALGPCHAVGRVGEAELADAWVDGLVMLRSLHDERRWAESELCRNCRMWDRP